MKYAEIQPYLFFGGRCDEAIGFYKAALGAQVVMLMRFNESPEPLPDGMMPPGFENKVLHAVLNIGGATLMLSDGLGKTQDFNAFSLSFAVKTEADADEVFNALAKGGKISTPIGKTFWSPRFGALEDRFGVSWMINVVAE